MNIKLPRLLTSLEWKTIWENKDISLLKTLPIITRCPKGWKRVNLFKEGIPINRFVENASYAKPGVICFETSKFYSKDTSDFAPYATFFGHIEDKRIGLAFVEKTKHKIKIALFREAKYIPRKQRTLKEFMKYDRHFNFKKYSTKLSMRKESELYRKQFTDSLSRVRKWPNKQDLNDKRMMFITDHGIDQMFNNNRFELEKVGLKDVSQLMDMVHRMADLAIRQIFKPVSPRVGSDIVGAYVVHSKSTGLGIVLQWHPIIAKYFPPNEKHGTTSEQEYESFLKKFNGYVDKNDTLVNAKNHAFITTVLPIKAKHFLKYDTDKELFVERISQQLIEWGRIISWETTGKPLCELENYYEHVHFGNSAIYYFDGNVVNSNVAVILVE